METTDLRTNPEAPQSSSTNPQTPEQIIAALQAKLKVAQPRADKDQVAQPGVAMNEDTLRAILGDFGMVQFKTHDFLHTFVSNDKSRHSGAGLKNIGFIDAAFECAEAHYQYIPSFRTLSEFQEAKTDFHNKRKLFIEVQGFLQKIYHSMLRSSDVAYHNALDYYTSVKEVARHESEGNANADYLLLSQHFKKSKPSKDGDEPTEAQLERDFRALLHGTKEGELTIRNENARTVGGKREVKDNAHKESSTIHTVIGTEKKD
jgi:hypothetical protein